MPAIGPKSIAVELAREENLASLAPIDHQTTLNLTMIRLLAPLAAAMALLSYSPTVSAEVEAQHGTIEVDGAELITVEVADGGHINLVSVADGNQTCELLEGFETGKVNRLDHSGPSHMCYLQWTAPQNTGHTHTVMIGIRNTESYRISYAITGRSQ
jgi:hypothetical protein